MNPVDLELVKLKRQWKKVVSKNEEKPMLICVGENTKLIFLTDF